jgi:hypothetical protein
MGLILAKKNLKHIVANNAGEILNFARELARASQ